MTSLTLEEFRQLVPPFEISFQAPMAAWRLDGQPRTARRYTTDQNCPLPTPEARLLFILVYLKTYPLQVVQGRLFGMGPEHGASVDSGPVGRSAGHAARAGGCSDPVCNSVGDAPRGARGGRERAGRLGAGPPSVSASPAATPAQAPASPCWARWHRPAHRASPRIRLSSRALIAARKRATPSNTCC